MASVQSSRFNKFIDEPVEHVESAGDILIKQLVQKQTNTNITLAEHLNEEKTFERGIGFVSLDALGSGSVTLQQFEQRQQRAERVEELEHRGLSRREAIALVTRVQRSKATPEAQAVVQQYVAPTPAQSTCTSSQHTQGGKRQERELALSVKPDSLETHLYQFAVSNESGQQITLPPDHPIHHLAAMERALVSSADPQGTARTIRRKRRQQLEAAEPPQVHYKPPGRHQSLWDAIESPILINKKPRYVEKKITCERQTLYRVSEGKIVKLGKEDQVQKPQATLPLSKPKPSGHAFVSLEKITESPEISGKLSEEEIRQMQRFKNYDRGKESKILYIKNLARDVTESDLAALFCQFQDPIEGNIIYRLMSGKMRGQAFITFKCCKNATEALKIRNGAILKGNPIIIQYGKQQEYTLH